MGTSRYTVGDGTIERARRLRREMTSPERKLRAVLRGRRLDGWKFRSQQRFGAYTADFCFHEARLLIELDGDTHAHSVEVDARRTDFIKWEGYRIIRFGNSDVISDLDGVFAAISAALGPSPSHPAAPGGPLPLPHGERGQ